MNLAGLAFFLSDENMITHLQETSLIAQLVKNPPVRQKTVVQFLAWEDALEKGKAAHSSVLGLPLWLSW